MKKNTNMEIRLLALSKEEKTCLVLYQALNCLLKHSIRSVYKELHADHETGAADNK